MFKLSTWIESLLQTLGGIVMFTKTQGDILLFLYIKKFFPRSLNNLNTITRSPVRELISV
jgi:hypothetical protein